VSLAGEVDTSYDCNGTNAQQFNIARGDGQITVPGTLLCLQAEGECASRRR
jgi:hypothetical protein